MTPEGTGNRLVSASVITMFDAPTRSPNSRTLAYTRLDLSGNDAELWTMRRDGSRQALLLGREPGMFGPFAPSYSPDGRHLTFSDRPANDGFGTHIYTAKADGTDVQQVTFDSQSTFNRVGFWGTARARCRS